MYCSWSNLSFPVLLHCCVACTSSICGDLALNHKDQGRGRAWLHVSLCTYTQMHMCLCILLRTDWYWGETSKRLFHQLEKQRGKQAGRAPTLCLVFLAWLCPPLSIAYFCQTTLTYSAKYNTGKVQFQRDYVRLMFFSWLSYLSRESLHQIHSNRHAANFYLISWLASYSGSLGRKKKINSQ